jgi:hypothetical protein
VTVNGGGVAAATVGVAAEVALEIGSTCARFQAEARRPDLHAGPWIHGFATPVIAGPGQGQ